MRIEIKKGKRINLILMMVAISGLEPLTSPLSGVRSNQLSYIAMVLPTGFEPVLPA